MSTAKDVMLAKTVKTAAKRFHAFLRIHWGESCTAALLDPEQSAKRGYGECWSVCWEEGPFEWAKSVTQGSPLSASEFGASNPGPFPKGLETNTWLAEPYNNYALCFYDN